MTKKKGKIKKKMHRQLGADLFNATWDLLDKPDRSSDEDEIMIHAAHASAHHWRQVGGPLNFERSNWQISRVYSLLNRPEAALYHARLCLETCLEEGIGDFDLAFAYEAMARAFGLDLDRFCELSLEAKRAIPISSQCSVFAETEVVSLVARRTPPPEIAAGIQAAVAKRVFALVRRVGLRPTLVVTGGCAKNRGLAATLAKLLRTEVGSLEVDAQLMGALGAAVIARRKGG